MRTRQGVLAACSLVLLALAMPLAAQDTIRVRIQTEAGTMTAELYAKAAPATVGDQPELDYGGKRNADGQGFAAFGRIVEGMAIARSINGMPAEGQSLRPPVRILSIERVK